MRYYLEHTPASAPDRDTISEVASRLRAFLN
jgi:hypothetical protein